MKNKLLGIVLICLLALCSLGLVACGSNNEHSHTYEQYYTISEVGHWRNSTCEHSNEKADYGTHFYTLDLFCEACGYQEGLEFELQADNTYAVKSIGTVVGDKVVIPDFYNGLPVTSIGDNALQNSAVERINMPNSILKIGDSAFYGCSKLISINIPNSVKSIGNSAFYNCSTMVGVKIGNSVQSIGEYAFSGCPSLTSVTIGGSVQSVGSSAFYSCSKLTKVGYSGTIDQWVMIEFSDSYSNPLYGAHNFYIDGKEITEVNITTATKIGDYAFSGATSITKVTMGNNVTSIGNNAFSECSTLTTINISNNITYVGDSAFSGCSRLQYNEYDNAYYL